MNLIFSPYGHFVSYTLTLMFFLLFIFPTPALSQDLSGVSCTQNYSRSIEGSRNNFAANYYCEYPDGTKSASFLSCSSINCCERYLTGTHTKGGEQYKSWRYINQLNCIDSNGKSKTYVDGKDADIPTNIEISAEKVNIAKTEGDNSPAIAGDKNVIEQQNINTNVERKWYEKPIGLIFISVLIGLIILVIKLFINRKFKLNSPTEIK